MTQLLVNAIITPDGTRLESTHRHDYQTYTDANGEEYMVDGGFDYIRRSVNNEPAIDASVTTESDHNIIREAFKWGTYGKNGDQPLVRKTLASLDTSHIEAILETQSQLREHIKKVFKDELMFRSNLGRLDYPDIV